ncbi:MerR family transcriptional regulator [Desulfitibacter alkalitolerans]|uniref:MerR family transcriptional regulator n=1 Tax=Desulfitibacter alkalitolerans TaxID=264641 RepID=UPI0006875247|nr:MerR family transcriptional regulator [Desulfitibacter alkalitolerans]
MERNSREPLFSISVAARLVGTSIRVLRYYEEMGLISPHRTSGNTRLYSNNDIKKLQLINLLQKEKDVNLSGIKIILGIIADQNMTDSKVKELLLKF